VMKLGDRVFIVMQLDRSPDGSFTGRVTGPKTFDMPMGKALRFSHITMPVQEKKISAASIENGHLRMVVDDPDAPGEPDTFELALVGEDQASLKLADVPGIAVFPFTRSHGRDVPRVATDWDPQRIYKLQDEQPVSSAEMRQVYEEDQRPRQDFTKLSQEQWKAIGKEDAVRRQHTRDLLNAGKLQTADDFREAAFIFQHGETPDDYLLAHTLAMIAVAKGDQGSLWIGTATLDRYLQSIQRPQIYGTQFRTGSGDTMTQDPFDRALISDLLREELGVPDLAAQQEQLKTFDHMKAAGPESK